MSERQPTRDRVTKTDAVAARPAFSNEQRAELAAFVQQQLDVVVDTLGGEIGTLERFQRERWGSELTAMRSVIEALRSEVARLRAEIAHEVKDSSADISSFNRGRSDAA